MGRKSYSLMNEKDIHFEAFYRQLEMVWRAEAQAFQWHIFARDIKLRCSIHASSPSPHGNTITRQIEREKCHEASWWLASHAGREDAYQRLLWHGMMSGPGTYILPARSGSSSSRMMLISWMLLLQMAMLSFIGSLFAIRHIIPQTSYQASGHLLKIKIMRR